MNKHFHDSLYYATRAGKHATLGVRESLAPHLTALRVRLGREPAPEPARLERVRTEFERLEQTAERRVRHVGSTLERRVR
ncbi:DUF7553 family protein [Natronorubrum thiooxidans]|uniref:Uncharacterized protein n=1 Tax=Natronorubrum thiooxidans TaxID=308853 RepID=A0A1N7FSZ4_9EURY|nr:hypothetical protein [Natronorubrum thiooxidans]SIS03463.1 hypothetical protein SAMN05421752_10857 [Natronorubrum thiooxidans]